MQYPKDIPLYPNQKWDPPADARYTVDDLTPTFTGSDIKAVIVRRDDDLMLKKTIDYLNTINAPLNVPNTPYAFWEYPPYPPQPQPGGDTEDIYAFNSTQDDSRYPSEHLITLLNLQTITISTYRTKQQVRALGQVNPRGIARGTRTIAGTMILAEFDRETFWKLITSNVPITDNNIGDAGEAVLPDQVAPFNLLLLFSNEMGYNAYRMIYELELVTNGIVYSIQDMYHENTVSFICTDVTPLTPLTHSNDLNKSVQGTSINPLNIVTSAKELVRRYRLLKNSRNNSF
jgi:hypothetical protein